MSTKYFVSLPFPAPKSKTVIRELKTGGERGIRTLDGVLPHTPLAGERLQPLGHLSYAKNYNICAAGSETSLKFRLQFQFLSESARRSLDDAQTHF